MTASVDVIPVAQLVDYAARLDVADVPAEVVAKAKTVLFDTVSVLLTASRQESMRTALKAFPLSGGAATVVGHGRGASPEMAAFINGIGGHDTELDDSHAPSRTHAASVIVPTALVAAEVGAASGATLLAGIVAGYDVQARISKAMGTQRQFDRGFHPTAVCGAIGAAIAAGRILGLTSAQLTVALSLGGTQSSGLRTYRSEKTHMHKSFQTGMAARNGMYAALLARVDYQAAVDPLTGKYDMITPFGGSEPDLGQLTDQLGERYEILDTSIKRHACCGQAHSSMDAFLALQSAHGFGADDIVSIDVELAHDAVPVIDNVPLWTHNLQHILAVLAIDRHFGREHVQEPWTSDPVVHALAARVTLRGNEELQANFPRQKGAIITVATKQGTYTQRCSSPKGSPSDPLSDDEMERKFAVLAAKVLDPGQSAQLWALREGFEHEADLTGFFRIVGGPGTGGAGA